MIFVYVGLEPGTTNTGSRGAVVPLFGWIDACSREFVCSWMGFFNVDSRRVVIMRDVEEKLNKKKE